MTKKINKARKNLHLLQNTYKFAPSDIQALYSLLVLPYQNYFYRCCAVLSGPVLSDSLRIIIQIRLFPIFLETGCLSLASLQSLVPFLGRTFQPVSPTNSFCNSGRAKM